MSEPEARGAGERAARRALLLFGLGVLTLRILALLGGADRIGEPDAAECKLTELSDRWILFGRPGWSDVLELARSGRNAPHGGFLPMSLLHAAIAVPRGALGDYVALKALAAALAALGACAWVAAAGRLGGRLAACGLAALLLLPPPALLGGTLVLWGSHAEAPALLGLLALVASLRAPDAVARREALAVGAAAGLAAGFDGLAAGVATLLLLGWAVDRGGLRGLAWASVSAAAVALPFLAVSGALVASVTEDPGATPSAILGGALAGSAPGTRILQALQTGRAFPVLGVAFADWPPRALIDGALGVAILGSGLLAAVRSHPEARGRALLWFVVAPAAHFAAVLCLTPRPEALPARYLLPLWGPALLGLACALAARPTPTRLPEFSTRRAAMRLVALAARPTARLVALSTTLALVGVGVVAVAPLIAPRRFADFTAWDPVRTTAADLGHVDFDLSGPVGVLLDRVGPRAVLPGPDTPRLPGLAAVLGTGSADAPLLDGVARRAPEDVADRLTKTIPSEAGPGRDAFLAELGAGLALAHRGRTAEQIAVISQLPAADRAAVRSAIDAAEADPALKPRTRGR